jgi:hypothetical protein
VTTYNLVEFGRDNLNCILDIVLGKCFQSISFFCNSIFSNLRKFARNQPLELSARNSVIYCHSSTAGSHDLEASPLLWRTLDIVEFPTQFICTFLPF